jgi:hypothetical protein
MVGVTASIDSPVAQVATERHSPNLPPAVDPAATPLPRYAFSILRAGVVPVTAGPGDEKAASAVGRGQLRAAHADREQVIGTLKAAFVQGRLTKGEFDLRAGQALASRTYAELAAITADLPAGLTAAQPPAPARAQAEWPILRRPGRWITAATALYAGTWAYELFLSPNGGDNPSTPPLILGGFLVYVIVLIIAAGSIVAHWLDRRSGRQLPRRPGFGAGGQASRSLAPADPGRQLPPAGHGRQHTAEAAPRHLPRLLPS